MNIPQLEITASQALVLGASIPDIKVSYHKKKKERQRVFYSYRFSKVGKEGSSAELLQ